jgi:DNA-binding transcriptional ArsR family regulator
VESSFAIIAEPNRRAILSLLASSEQTVGDIERHLRMPQTSVSKHLRVLRESGFVEARADAQRRVYRLRPEPLMEVDAWLTPFRRLWESHVDALERHLDRMAQARAQQQSSETSPTPNTIRSNKINHSHKNQNQPSKKDRKR